jgi:hypothetical protein
VVSNQAIPVVPAQQVATEARRDNAPLLQAACAVRLQAQNIVLVHKEPRTRLVVRFQGFPDLAACRVRLLLGHQYLCGETLSHIDSHNLSHSDIALAVPTRFSVRVVRKSITMLVLVTGPLLSFKVKLCQTELPRHQPVLVIRLLQDIRDSNVVGDNLEFRP